MVDFSEAKEMAPFLQEPKAMYVGAPGKTGFLFMGFELDKKGKSIMRNLDRRAPLIVQQELYFDAEMPEMPCVYILSSGGPNVDGDRYEQNITVRKDAYAFVSTGAATKLAEMKYNYSGLKQHFIVEDNAYLEFLPEPLIPCRNTRFISHTLLTVAPTATVFYAEIFMGGRKHYDKGEAFEYDVISVCSQGERPDGERLYREKFIVRPNLQTPRILGIMDKYDVFANVIVMTPPDKAELIYSQIMPYIDNDQKLALGITHLPNNAGLLVKVLGMEPGPVKNIVREFCSTVRQVIKGKPLPKEFPWR
ncbi:urease accessory protein UreD [Sphingobacterium rhinopitheci]|uniref:urease accessory protein UreD n=1 Tax=Sphingobacterium rhinopitheci TaxID=2781960 RepID=UPI001F51E333|nr:urease accessory protein UreD [Sphingobacterium rhinopitheci]MCI0922643.1 urease accessory protein UreD [Sphingobacterium rhinopitheci]